MKDDHTVGGKCGTLTFFAKNGRKCESEICLFFEADGFSAIVPPSENSKNKKVQEERGKIYYFP